MSMQAWQASFNQLKEQFQQRLAERLDKANELVALLVQRPGDAEIVTQLSRLFHWLKGSGTMYGYPQITALGAEAESYCNARLRSGLVLTVDDVEKLKNFLNEISAQFRAPTEAPKDTVSLNVAQAERALSNKPQVLVLTENVTDMAALNRVLEDEGLEPRPARAINQVLSEITQSMPAAMIITVPLPDGNAYDFVEQIRQLDCGNDPAIIILSKQAGFLDKVQSIHCGADAFFEKPIDMKVVLRRLHFLLDRRRAQIPRILSVEDDPDQASFIRVFLESAGYLVRTCSDPKDFETELASFSPNLILLDVMLPGIKGYELARYLRQDERYATLPVIFLTAEGNIEARIEGALSGGDDHLVKPVPPALLLSAVASRLERSRFLKTLLHSDGLTNLLNHSTFMEQAQMVIAQHKRHARNFALIMIDIDYLASINERHGYTVGDKVLVALSFLLHKKVRQSDIVGRYGGNVFSIITEGLNREEATALASRLLSDFAATSHTTPLHAGFYATCSAGICMLDPQIMDANTWIKSAFTGLKSAKTAGRNCVMSANA